MLLLLFFYLNGDHDTVAFPSGLDGYLFMTANYQHLTQLQSLDSLGRCLVLITNRWLAGAICWYQSFSFAGDDACGSVCVYWLMNNDECEVIVVVTTIALWWIGCCYQHHCFDRSMFDIDRYSHTHTLIVKCKCILNQSQWSIRVVLFFSLTRTLLCWVLELQRIKRNLHPSIVILILLQR